MDCNKVVDILKPYVTDKGLEVYSVEWLKENDSYILRVCLYKNDGNLDFDELTECNDFLSSALDAVDAEWPPYFLEVSSAGAERPLRNYEEVLKSKGKYIFLRTAKTSVYGFLEDVCDKVVKVKYNAKGRFKILSVNYDEIVEIRLAVKF